MSCQCCVGAVKRVLGKMEGVDSFDIDIEKQKVTVKGNVQPEAVLHNVSKNGKATSFCEVDEPAPTGKPESKLAKTESDKPAPAAEPESKPVETVVAA